jgi:hypothetical protein
MRQRIRCGIFRKIQYPDSGLRSLRQVFVMLKTYFSKKYFIEGHNSKSRGQGIVHMSRAAMAEWLCCLVRCSNLGATRHRMTLEKALTAVYLGSPGWCILITWDIHRPFWLVSMFGELKWWSGGTLRQAGLLSRATASNSCLEIYHYPYSEFLPAVVAAISQIKLIPSRFVSYNRNLFRSNMWYIIWYLWYKSM